MTTPLRWSVCCCIVFFAITVDGCDEQLPPRDEPQKFLEADLQMTEGAVEIRDSVAVGMVGRFLISVKNIYIEVLQDEEYARADIDVWLRDMPDQRATVVATRQNLTDPSIVSGGMLTLPPGVTATFLAPWGHRTTGGTYFWEFVGLHFVAVPNSNGYWESDPVHFAARGRVQLFKNRAPEVLPEIQFTLVYRLWEP